MDEVLSVTIKMHVVQLYFPLLLFIAMYMYKVIQNLIVFLIFILSLKKSKGMKQITIIAMATIYLPVQERKMSLMRSTSFSWTANFIASG